MQAPISLRPLSKGCPFYQQRPKLNRKQCLFGQGRALQQKPENVLLHWAGSMLAWRNTCALSADSNSPRAGIETDLRDSTSLRVIRCFLIAVAGSAQGMSKNTCHYRKEKREDRNGKARTPPPIQKKNQKANILGGHSLDEQSGRRLDTVVFNTAGMALQYGR